MPNQDEILQYEMDRLADGEPVRLGQARRIPKDQTMPNIETSTYDQFVEAMWHGAPDPNYTMIALGGEVGEVLNAYKKHELRAEGARGHDPENNVPDELGDVLYYVARAAHEQGLSLSDLMKMNMTKLLDRAREAHGGEELPPEIAIFEGEV